MTDNAVAHDTAIAAPHADPGAKRKVTSPRFHEFRAGALGVLLHVAPLVAVLLVLHWDRLPVPRAEPSLELIIDKSPYVGSGPQALVKPVVPVSSPVPQQAAPQAAPKLNVPPPMPPLPQSAVALPVPPPLPPAPPHPAYILHAAPREVRRPISPVVPHIGDNQPAGHGQAFGRMILASPDPNLNPKPPYPEDAREHGEQGRVLLSIHVAANGRASEVDIVSSSGFTILDRAAQSAALNWVFNPAMLDGRPVASEILFPILFQLDAP